MPTIHLLDNDIVLKSARYDLLSELQWICGGIEQIRILNTLRWKFHLDTQAKAIEYCCTIDAYNRLVDFDKSAPYLDEPNNKEDIIRLNDLRNLDQGEVLLFAYNISQPGSMTFTGDKRAILSISNAAEVTDLVSTIKGRVKCLEQIAAEILLAFDADQIREKINHVPDCDKSLRSCFSSGMADDIMMGLRSYYNDLNSKTNGILAPFPSS